jgi:hypothetical protein
MDLPLLYRMICDIRKAVNLKCRVMLFDGSFSLLPVCRVQAKKSTTENLAGLMRSSWITRMFAVVLSYRKFKLFQ